METLELKKRDAINAYNNGDAGQKQLLERLYGKETFNQKITDRVKTFDDACNVLGIKSDVFGYALPSELKKDAKSIAAYTKLIIIARALNEGWEPDYNNVNEAKYYPWFKKQPAPLGFSFYDYDFAYALTDLGARLVFKSSELAEYAGRQFEDIYKDFITL